jgi:putative phosphoribosyl transferase
LTCVNPHHREFGDNIVGSLGVCDMMFVNRTEAGAKLAERLLRFKNRKPVVLALVRGGVPIAYEIAKALAAPLDIVLVRKIGAPGQPELAAGAVVDGARPDTVRNPDVIAALEISDEYIREEAERQLAEIERRRSLYAHGRPAIPIGGRTAIVVDDGIATGATMRAALRALRRQNPARLVLAVPVAALSVVDELKQEADEIVCVETPERMAAIGLFYSDFRQVEDHEVIELLDRAALPSP